MTRGRALGVGVLLTFTSSAAFTSLLPRVSNQITRRAAGLYRARSQQYAPLPAQRTRERVSTTATDANVTPGESSTRQDTEQAEAELASPSTSTVFVAGGSGFVGSEICKQLVDAGCNVIALSRKGAPSHGPSWTKSVKWVKGNAVNQEAYRAELRKSDAVVSCVGGFGKTDAYMELINGEANIKLAEAAADAGVKQFTFVSVHDYKAPGFVKRVGYFEGKRRAERVIGELFAEKGVVLKPAFIYGERKVKLQNPNGEERVIKLPLQRIGGPLSRITSSNVGKRIAESGLPLADVAWTQPLSTEAVAKAAVRCCLEGSENFGVRGKDSGKAVVVRVKDIAQMA